MFLFYSVTFFMVVMFPMSLRILKDSSLEVPPVYSAPLAYSNFSKLFFSFWFTFFLFHFKVFLKDLVILAV